MRLTTAALLALCASSIGILSAQQTGSSWKDYLGAPDGSHYSPLKQIDASNVSKMEIAWTYPAPDGTSVFCPLVVDNIAYISAKGGALVALDATTGKELWAHSFGTGAGDGAESAGSAAGTTGKAKTAKTAASSSPRPGICMQSMP
jgi:quinoprotein glucose dehydrogenase